MIMAIVTPPKNCYDPTRRQNRLSLRNIDRRDLRETTGRITLEREENVRRLVKSPYGLKQAPMFRTQNLTTS